MIRGQRYEEFKNYKTEIFIYGIGEKVPQTYEIAFKTFLPQRHILSDYIGVTFNGSCMAMLRTVNIPFIPFVLPEQNQKNLFIFYRSKFNMHGNFLGVTIGKQSSPVPSCLEKTIYWKKIFGSQ